MNNLKIQHIIAILFIISSARISYCDSDLPKPFPKAMKAESEFKATESLFKSKLLWVQENPNSSDVMTQLKDLYDWVGGAPYVKASHHTQYIPGFMDQKKAYAKFDVLFWVYTYAQVACSFDATGDDHKHRCIETGIRSMITCYRNICSKNANLKWGYMENYISRLDSIGVSKFLNHIDDSIAKEKRKID